MLRRTPPVAPPDAMLCTSRKSFFDGAASGFASQVDWWYHMYGATVNALRLKSSTAIVWTKSGAQGNSWQHASVMPNELLPSITFEGVRGNSYTGDIALDDLTIYCLVQPPSPPPSDNPIVVQGFESSSLGSGWATGSTGISWTRKSGGTPSDSTGPSSARSGSYYMYIETSSPRVSGDTFDLTYTCAAATHYVSRVCPHPHAALYPSCSPA